MGRRQRHAEHGVGAELGLVLGAVEFEQQFVEVHLSGGVMAVQARGDLSLTLATALRTPRPRYRALVLVAQFQRLVGAGAGAAGHGGAADGAVGQDHFDFQGRVAAAVQNLAGVNVFNRAHRVYLKLR